MIDVPASIPMITSRMNSASFDDHPLQPPGGRSRPHITISRRRTGKTSLGVLAKPPAPVTVKFLACFAKNSAFVKIGASAASIKAMQRKASRGDTGFIDLRPLPQQSRTRQRFCHAALAAAEGGLLSESRALKRPPRAGD